MTDFEPLFRKVRLALFASALLLLGACSAPIVSTVDAPALPARLATSAAPPAVAQDYRLSVGDSVEIKLFYNPELNELQVVRPDGRITMQLIGELQAAGLTTAEVEAQLKTKYTGILRTPTPSVFVRKYVQQRVFVGGQVSNPSAVPVEGPLTLMQAIFHSGGFKFTAEKRNVLVFRNNGLPNAEVLVVNLEQQLNAAQTSTDCEPMPKCAQDVPAGTFRRGDVALLPNDIVYIPQTAIGQLAQYMDENIYRIIPLFRNIGVNMYYQLNKELRTTTTIVPQ